MSKKIYTSVTNGGEKWAAIPAELLALVVVKIPADEMVRVVPLVCKAWLAVVCGPHCWKNIDLLDWSCRKNNSDQVDAAVKKLVRYSRGTFQKLLVYGMGNGSFTYAASRAECLKILNVSGSSFDDHTVIQHTQSLTNVTHLDISYCDNISCKGLEAFGKHCKSLISLIRNMAWPMLGMSVQEQASLIDESEAMVIANTMSKLQHLEICGGCFTNCGLNSLLTKCNALEYLDIRGCYGVWWDEAVEKKCGKLACFVSPWIDDDDDDDEAGEFSDADSEYLSDIAAIVGGKLSSRDLD